MKERRVVVTIELTTDAPIKSLKDACKDYFTLGGDIVHQVQVNVIKKEKK